MTAGPGRVGGPLAHAVDGRPTAFPVVMGSSLGTDASMWDPQVPALSRHFRVVRYDHLGHGGSAVPPGPYTVEQLATAVLDTLDGMGVDRFHYVGLSLGGLVGQWLAVHEPQRVARLALLCTAAAFPPPSAWTERAAAVRAGGTAAVADAVLQRWFTADFPGVAAFRELVVAQPAEGYAGCCEALATADLTADLPTVTAPTLCIAGREDPSTPPDRLAEIASLVPGARLEIVDGAAHLANVERADVITPMLMDFLQED